MKQILIPTDFSANSWNALAYAVQFFKKESCTFYILHIGNLKESTVNHNSVAFPLGKISPLITEKIKFLFQRIKGLPNSKSHHFIALQEYGNFIDIIRKVVDTKKIDLIVMGTKGASGIKASIVGSNTGDVITKVSCNVLVIPENAVKKIPERIAFPTDYNLFYTFPILKSLTELLRISGAQLHIFHITRTTALLKGFQENNRRYLKDYLEELFPETYYFNSITHESNKAAILNFVADNQIEMLTMVAKNLNYFQQLLFDTTIEKLSFHTTIPLLVLHE